MKNKHLLSLLVIPFLLTGCGGNSVVKGGDKGDPVLTQEQIDALTVTTPKGYEGKVAKVGSVTIPAGATNYTESYNGQLAFYTLEDPEVDKEVVFSYLKGGVILEIPNLSKLQPTSGISNNQALYSAYGLDCLVVKSIYKDELDNDVVTLAAYDALGTKLIEYKGNDKNVEVAIEARTREVPVKSNGGETYTHRYAIAYYVDPKTNKAVENVFEYDAKMESAAKVDNYYDSSLAIEKDSARKFYKEKKDEKIEYIVRPYTVYNGSAIGIGYEVSHVEEDKTVYATYFIPDDATSILFDHHIVYQLQSAVDDHDLEYTYTSGGSFYKVNTYVIDLLEGTTKPAEFPYILGAGSSLDEPVAYGEIPELSKYAAAYLTAIENRRLADTQEYYVIDSYLELHDDLGNIAALTKLGTSHYINRSSTSSVTIYNTDKVPVKTINATQIRVYPNCVVIKSNNYYGIIDENGNYLVSFEERFSSCNLVSKDTVLLSTSGSITVKKCFNIETLKELKLVYEDKMTYLTGELQYGFRIGKGDGTETIKDKVYFLNEVLATYDVDPAIAFTRRADLNLAANPVVRAVYESVEHVDADGNTVHDIFRAEYNS